MASILNLPEVTCWLSLRVAAIVLRSHCLKEERATPTSPVMAVGFLAGSCGWSRLSHIPIRNMDLFRFLSIHGRISHHRMTADHCPWTMSDTWVSREESGLVPVLAERQACDKSCDKCYYQGKNKIKAGVYRNIFQRSCKLNQALKYE